MKSGVELLKIGLICITIFHQPHFYASLFQRRLEGTKVTVESFMAWKAKFDEERLSQKEVVVKEKRLTGKELFLQNIELNESDLQFITEGINHSEAGLKNWGENTNFCLTIILNSLCFM